MRTITAISCAIIGVSVLSFPAFAQQKTVKACQEEWRANKDANQAKGITEKAYVTQCRAGGVAAQPAPSTTPAAAPAPAASGEKTAKACRDEWRANKDANQAKGITEKAYVTQCRAGGTVASPAPMAPPPLRREQQRHPRRLHLHPQRRRELGQQQRPQRVQISIRLRGKPDSGAAAAPLCGPIWIQKSITSPVIESTERRRPGRICASRMRRAKACAPPRTRSIPSRLWAEQVSASARQRGSPRWFARLMTSQPPAGAAPRRVRSVRRLPAPGLAFSGHPRGCFARVLRHALGQA